MVPPSVNGIYNGMIAFTDGKVGIMNVDYEQYNKLAAEEFEKLISR